MNTTFNETLGLKVLLTLCVTKAQKRLHVKSITVFSAPLLFKGR